MKKIFLLAVLLFSAAAWSYDFKQLPRSIKISGTPQKITGVTVVKDAANDSITLAVSELRYALKELCGFEIKESAAPAKDSFNIILGNGKLAKAAGIKDEMIPQEGYVMLRSGNNLYIAGYEEAKDCGTLFGTYELLERFGNIRYYFPGKYGTLIPKGKGLYLPQRSGSSTARITFTVIWFWGRASGLKTPASMKEAAEPRQPLCKIAAGVTAECSILSFTL